VFEVLPRTNLGCADIKVMYFSTERIFKLHVKIHTSQFLTGKF
jgi:hypothetical protein